MIDKILIKKLNLSLIFILSIPVFAVAIYWFRFSSSTEFIIFTLAAIFYLIVALIHHFREKTLILEIMIEYILIAVLALVVIQSLIL